MLHFHVPDAPASGADTPDFMALDAVLRECSAAMAAAEAHGHLCGWVCAAGETPQGVWVEQVFGGFDALAAGCPHGEPLLSGLYVWTCAALRSEDLGFALFLPEDEAPMGDRIHPLRGWCRGFLSGVGLGRGSAALPDSVAEVLRDMAEMSRIAEDAGGDTEEDEQAYMEIVEYLRACVWLTAEALRPAREAAPLQP